MNAGNRTYNLKKLKEEYPHLLVLKDSTINFGDVKVILGQDCYHLHRAIDYRKCGNAKPWAVRTKLGWMLSGPLPQRESAKLATENLFAAELDPLAGQMKTCWSIDLYTLNCSVSGMFEANKKNSQDIFFVERKWQEVSTKTLLVEIKQVWQEEMQLVAGDHNIVKQGAKKEFSITEEKNEHERVAITSNFQTSEKICVTLDLPKQSIGVASVQQLVKEKYSTQLQAMNVTVNTLTLEEGKKCSQLDRENGFVNECQIELHEVPSGKAIYRRHFSGLLERDQPAEENANNGTTSVNVSFGRKHDVDLKEKMPDKIIPNDSENRNNWLGNGNSGMDAVAQANPNAYTQLSSGHRKQFEKRVLKCEHSSNLLHGMFESVQLTTGILSAKIVIDELADEISLMETRLGSSKAQTTTSSENGPFIVPAASWEEMMVKLEFFGKWKHEEVRQLEVNDLVWIKDENVKRARYKIGRVLEVYHGSDGRVRSALVKTEDGKLKRPVVKLAPMFYESVFQEKNRAGNVGASHQKTRNFDSEHTEREKKT